MANSNLNVVHVEELFERNAIVLVSAGLGILCSSCQLEWGLARVERTHLS